MIEGVFVNWFDDYEIRARILPAIIVFLPIMIPIFLIIHSEMSSISSFLFSGLVLAAILYPLSFIIRISGSNFEKELWNQWDGPPSTRILRWRDKTLTVTLKTQLHEAVRSHCGITLSSIEEEQNNPYEADEKIRDAFTQVKHFVYYNDPNGIWKKFNAEYGFNRNLLGNKHLWISLSTVGVITCGVCWYFARDSAYIVGATIDTAILIIVVVLVRYVLPTAVKDPAERYAASIWHSFLTILKKNSL